MRLLLSVSLLTLTSCQGVLAPTSVWTDRVIAPALAVMAAADAAPRGFPGTFGFVVRRADPVDSRFFLNSYVDYRDQRNLSVAIDAKALPALRAQYGNDLRAAFLGREIRVEGLAFRRRIDFTYNRRPTGKYYFQTHVDVIRPEQIRIVG